MNASLVALYGTTPKPPELEKLTSNIQDVLEGEKGLGFIRYKPNQVHATVAGLEGLRVGEQIVSTNVAELRRRVKLLDLEDVVRRLRSSRHLPLKVRLGGFELASNYSFVSRGLHPQIRSFSIHGRIVVAMGWPVAGATYPPSLDLLRRELACGGALHKYHGSEGEVDNDFFFVLGQIERRERDHAAISKFQDKIRKYLSESKPVDLDLGLDALSFVAYEETTLAPDRACQFSLDDIATDPQRLVQLYEAAV